ncbi:MAG: hypothetical protein LBU32_09740 [Clostridiales bacterium]|jgi:rubrerythrin|nr:hypothetical protein [Clostridiales bacterium]
MRIRVIGEDGMEVYKRISPSDHHMADAFLAALEDERKNCLYIEELSQIAVDKSHKDLLSLIKLDEKKHAFLLGCLFKKLTGKDCASSKPTRKSAGKVLAKEYEETFFYLLDAADFYRSIYSSTSNNDIKDAIFEIIVDEQNNALRVEHLLNSLNRRNFR